MRLWEYIFAFWDFWIRLAVSLLNQLRGHSPKPRYWNDFMKLWPGVDLWELKQVCRDELVVMAEYAYVRYGWICYVHEGFAYAGHTENSQHYLGLAIDLHFEKDGEVVPLFDQFILSIRFDWNGLGLYPFWDHPGLHCDMRQEGKLKEAALWWKDSDQVYKALNSRFLDRIFQRR